MFQIKEENIAVSLQDGIGTKTEEYTCDVCHKCFSNSRHLNMHLKIHLYLQVPNCHVIKEEIVDDTNSDIKPFKCEYCTETFRQLATFNLC